MFWINVKKLVVQETYVFLQFYEDRQNSPKQVFYFNIQRFFFFLSALDHDKNIKAHNSTELGLFTLCTSNFCFVFHSASKAFALKPRNFSIEVQLQNNKKVL